MSNPISRYNRPQYFLERYPEEAQKIQDMLPFNVRINWRDEEFTVSSPGYRDTVIPMEVFGKMFGIMQQHCVTVRKSAKESKIKIKRK